MTKEFKTFARFFASVVFFFIFTPVFITLSILALALFIPTLGHSITLIKPIWNWKVTDYMAGVKR